MHSTSALSFEELSNLSYMQQCRPLQNEEKENNFAHNFVTSNRDFYPVQSRSPVLDRFQELVERDLVTLNDKVSSQDIAQKCDNLSYKENRALKELMLLKDIVIKQADKGGAVVVLDSYIYKKQNLAMLEDNSTYLELDHNPTPIYQQEMLRLLTHGLEHGFINQKQLDYIFIQHPVIPIFHSLPKIHKGGFPQAMRPIVAGIGSFTERLSAWVDSILQPLVQSIPGYLQDTRAVLQAFYDFKWEQHFSWITADVTSLYTVIPHNLAMVSLVWFLNVYSDFSATFQDFVCRVVLFLLKHNVFMFSQRYFLQLTGVSMGAKFSPSMANIYMAWWECHFLFSADNPWSGSLRWYGRYIDDLLFVWSGDTAAVPSFGTFLNSNHCCLKFTISHDITTIAFLDLSLEGDSATHQVHSSTYRKDTSGNTTLMATSCHPPHVVRNIPKGEFIRAKTNCSKDDKLKMEMEIVAMRLAERRYPPWTLDRARAKTLNRPRDRLVFPDKAQPDLPSCINRQTNAAAKNVPCFVTNYSLEFSQICAIVTKHLSVLNGDEQWSDISSAGVRCIARRAPTIAQKISPSLFTDSDTSKKEKSAWLRHKGTFKCGHRICTCCNYIKTGSAVVSTATHNSFNNKQYANCNTNYVVYCITCTICSLQYIGCTTNSLKVRICKHLSDIPHTKERNVSAASLHFAVSHQGDTAGFPGTGPIKG
ncbi:protein YAE1 homolog isoform X1 [Bufo gargarizans]|uniref:protein YAE1 homolog isoform X1 n=1 Tax=Bufo gargarizans TaxID=30331 RepID=UPI001CF319A4|nr:protein YAE1 homolog isoform X1 [Bufo gargarizans]